MLSYCYGLLQLQKPKLNFKCLHSWQLQLTSPAFLKKSTSRAEREFWEVKVTSAATLTVKNSATTTTVSSATRMSAVAFNWEWLGVFLCQLGKRSLVDGGCETVYEPLACFLTKTADLLYVSVSFIHELRTQTILL